MLRSAVWALLEEGFEVSRVPTPREALERVTASPPDIIVVNGPPADEKRVVVERIRRTSAPMRILGLRSEPPDDADWIRAEGVLTKPFDASALVKEIRETLARPVLPPLPDE